MICPPPVGFRLEPLKNHDRSGFSCGVESLDRYFASQLGQDARRLVATAYLLVEDATDAIAGFYTLSALAVDAGALPPEMLSKLPRYRSFPATLLGRLAVDRRFAGRNFGKWLLMDACFRSLARSSEIASLGVVVDAVDENAARFYERFAFRRLPGQHLRLFLPMKTVRQLGDSPSR